MARKGYGRHTVVATGSNNPTKQISRDAWNDDLDKTGMLGLESTSATIVISSGNLTPTDTWTVVESETSPSADDLANILTTETSTEDILFIVGKSGDTITLKHQATGAGQIHTSTGADKTLDTNVPTLLIRRGTDWYEFGGQMNDLNGIENVNITSVTDEEFLVYDTGTSKWINQTKAELDLSTITGTETLTNKTLTTPIISTISNTGTITLPTSTTTLVGTDTTDTLTNKTLTTPIISSISNTGTLTLPTSTDTLVGRDTTDTLTNKTLTTPIISTISNTGTITLPTSTDTLVGKATTDTLTNKTINGDNNTISNLAHGAEVDNPSTNVHGVTGNIVGSSDTQTLTNKTLTNPKLGASYLDVDIMSAPSDPSAGSGRIYLRTIDANNDGLFIKVKKAGSFVEVQIG